MPRIRVTFYMKNQEGLGWSETLFSTRATIQLAMADAFFLYPKRVNLNGNDVSLFYIRASDDEVKRDAEIFRVPKNNQSSKDADLGPSEDANTALDVALKAGDLQRGMVFMSGIPDNIVQTGGAFTPSAVWQANYAIWSAAVTAGAWGLRHRNEAAGSAAITNMTQNGTTGVITVTTAAPHGYAVGTYVNILQVGGATRGRGVWRIMDVPSPTTFTYKIKMILQPYTGGGIARALEYQVNSYSSTQVVKVGHHDRGRPFGSPRGRRRVI